MNWAKIIEDAVTYDDYVAKQAEAGKLDVHEIREHTWAIFPCCGAMPLPLQELNRRIFSE